MAAGEEALPAAGPAEPNPFSFREFVRNKARGGEGPGGDRQGGPKRRLGSSGGSEAPVSASLFSPPQAAEPGPGLDPSPGLDPIPFFFPDLSPRGEAEEEDDDEEEEEEEEWSESYQPLAVERAHLAAAGSPSPSAGSFLCRGPLGSGERSATSPGAPLGSGFEPLRQPSYEELQEENASLRSKIHQLQGVSDTQAAKMRKLERKLEENKIKEEKETQDLEAMVQHVEQNLQLMTKRAAKAESSAAKLRQENLLLQAQLNNYKTENEALRSQAESLAVMKQNTELALEQLLRVISTSRSSLRQLVSGAESLQLVADLLKSIDRISEASECGQ